MCFLNTNVTSTNALWANVQARMSSTDYALDYNSTNRLGVIKKVEDIRRIHSSPLVPFLNVSYLLLTFHIAEGIR